MKHRIGETEIWWELVARPREEVVAELLAAADKYEAAGCPMAAAVARKCAKIRSTQRGISDVA